MTNPPNTRSTSTQQDDYDSPWKETIEHYFEDFILFFFPDAHSQIDWSQDVNFLDQELRSVVQDGEIGKRYVDKLVSVKLKKGGEQWVYIHIEVQSSYDNVLGMRVFTYNYRIFDKFNRPVGSLVILADDKPNWRPNRYSYDVLGSTTSIQYPIAKLTDYQDDEEALLASDNPFALFTLAHFKTRATRGNDPERYQVKMTLIELLGAKGWTPERINHLLKAQDDMLYLPPELNEKLWYEITEHKQETVMNYLATLEHKALERGKMEGRVEGEANLLKKLLERRFGPLPSFLTEKLEQAREDELERWGEAVLTAPTLEAVFQLNTLH